MLFDLHVHSSISGCSSLSPAEIVENSRSLGLDGVCITDHDTTDIVSQITEGFQPDGLLVLVGVEYTTPQGDFLVYGPVEALPKGLDAITLLNEAQRLGCAVVAAHPYREWRPTDVSVLNQAPCTAVEVLNGRNNEYENTLACGLATQLGLASVAGSDAHTLSELGKFPTWFDADIQCRSDLVSALKNGQCSSARPVSLLSKVG